MPQEPRFRGRLGFHHQRFHLRALCAGALITTGMMAVAYAPAGANVPTWGSLSPLSGSAVAAAGQSSTPTALSCGGNGDCAMGGTATTASGTAAWVATESGGHWSTSTLVQPASGANYALFSQGSTFGGVSCTAVGSCTAFGSYLAHWNGMTDNEFVPWVMTETKGVWSAATALTYATEQLSFVEATPHVVARSLSCVSPGNCELVGTFDQQGSLTGSASFVVAQTGGVWQTVAPLVNNDAGPITDATVDCVGSTWCLAGANVASIGTSVHEPRISIFSQNKWSPLSLSAYDSLNNGINQPLSIAPVQAVSCGAVGDCTIAGQYGITTKKLGLYVAAITTTSTITSVAAVTAIPGIATLANGGSASVTGLACTSAGDCSLVGTYVNGAKQTEIFTDTEVNGAWGTATLLAGSKYLNLGNNDALTNLSCIADQVCAAAGFYTDGLGNTHTLVANEIPAGWYGVGPLPDATELNGGNEASVTALACATTGSCAAAGDFTYATAPANSAAAQPFVDNAYSSAPNVNPPGEPTNVTALPGSLQALVSWTAPSTGGSPITSYTVTASPGGSTCTTATTGCAVPQLQNGTTYTFTVVATNIAGVGNPSLPSNDVSPSPLPSPPVNVTLSVNANVINVSWQPPVSSGSPVTSYTATASPGGKNCVSTTLTCRITGLTNGTRYAVSVVAHSTIGASPPSAVSFATPEPLPNAPTNVKAKVTGIGRVVVTWSAPVPNGSLPIKNYTVTSSPTGYGCTVAAVTCTINGIANGVSLSFVVTAASASGPGTPSAPTGVVTTPRTPSSPVNVSVAVSSATLTVHWSAPASSGGEPVSEYIVSGVTKTQTATCATTAPVTSCALVNLTNGTAYSVTVVAVNAVGSSAPSSAVVAQPARVPAKPTRVSAKWGALNAIVVRWHDSPNDGGSPVTQYTVTATPGGATCSVSPPASDVCTFSNLRADTFYAFSVVAINAAGPSAATTPTTALEPLGVPDAPSNVKATAGAHTVTVTWSAALGGGTPVLSYGATITTGNTSNFCQVTTSPLSCTFSGLTDGATYSISIVANNAQGASTPSTTVTVIPGVVPSAPTNVGVSAQTRSATVSWHAPLNLGDPHVLRYEAFATHGTTTYTCGVAATSLSCAIYGLTKGVVYTVTVIAINVVGNSPPSTAVRVTPK